MFESAFAVWTLAGLSTVITRGAAFTLFAAFAGISLSKALMGAESCGCFGTREVNPYITFAMDTVIAATTLVSLIFRDKSKNVRGELKIERKTKLVLLCCALAAGVYGSIVFTTDPNGNENVLTSVAIVFFLIAACQAVWRGLELLNDRLSPERLTCAEDVYDLGVVADNEKPQHTFELVNSGRRPIAIHDVKQGCSACVEVIDFEKQTLQPGEKAKVTIALLPEDLTGRVKKAALVKYGSNPQKLRRVLVYLEADVLASAKGVLDEENAVAETPSSPDVQDPPPVEPQDAETSEQTQEREEPDR